MTDSDLDPLSGSLIYEDRLPLSWEERLQPSFHNLYEELKLTEQNERLLNSVALLQEKHVEPQEDEHEWSADLTRIEAKIDMLIEYVAQQLNQGGDEEKLSVRLGSHGIGWDMPNAGHPKLHQKIWVYLKPDPGLFQALQFPAQICGIRELEEGIEVTAKFEGLGENVTGLLEKMIFRQHRRKVAFLKSRQNG